jgi:hypothetical protein
MRTERKRAKRAGESTRDEIEELLLADWKLKWTKC